MAFHRREFAEKNSREINQVNALVNQFAAAGKFRVRAPFLFVADASALAVTAAHKHHRAERAAAENFQRLQTRRMIAMIVADADERAGFLRGSFKFIQFRHAEMAAGFFDENVFAVFHRRQRNRRERGIDRGNDHHIHIRIERRRAQRIRVAMQPGLCAAISSARVKMRVARDRDAAGRQQVQPLLSDESAADEGNA